MDHPYFALPTPLVIGHRGCAGGAPENTLPAFARGLAEGAVILETDVHLTRDGVPVLIHDPIVDRVSDGSGPVASLTLDELRRLDAGHRFSPDDGASHPYRGRGIAVPTFEEALKEFPEARFNVELKDDAPHAAAATVAAVRACGADARTLLTAGDSGIMRSLREQIAAADCRVAHGASLADILAVLKSAEEGCAPDTPAMALQIPAEFGGDPLVTRELVDHAHAHGIQIHVWTINEPDEMTQLLDLGVDGIVTDFPGRLAELIGGR